MSQDRVDNYPLGTLHPELVNTPSGIPFSRVSLDAARDGLIRSTDMRATGATLRSQAQIARQAGREQLADNLDRAAELAVVPDDLLLGIYTALRPGRATAEELEDFATSLEGYGAHATASFIREAANVYRERGLIVDE